MADRIAEARNGHQEEAAAETAPAPAAKPATSLNPWLPLIITVVTMPLLAYATTRYVLIPQMNKAINPPAAPAESAAAGTNGASGPALIDGKPKVTVAADKLQKILVNVAGTLGTRYLMTSVTLVGADESFKDKIKNNQDQLKDVALGTLCTKTISDLEKPGSRNVIRAELLGVFNNALGGSLIKEIYITELSIQ